MYIYRYTCIWGFPGGSVVKNLPACAGDAGLIPKSRRSPGEENGNPLPGLPGKSHGQRRLAGYRTWRCKVRHDLATKPTPPYMHTHTHTHTHTHIHTHTLYRYTHTGFIDTYTHTHTHIHMLLSFSC